VSFHPPLRGALKELIEAHDWAASAIGPRTQWPRTLSGYVAMILELRTPAIVFWGPEQTQIYNDGYALIMGPRHPRFLGESYRACWPDTYPTIYPWMRAVLDRGETVNVERTYIPVTRHGFDEEAWFSFTFTPLVDDAGAIAGILQLVIEMTEVVLEGRRAATLRSIASLGPEEALLRNRDDVPSFLIGPATSETAERIGDTFVVPIRRNDDDPVTQSISFGISPRLRFDKSYRDFFESVAREIAAGHAAEQERLAQREAEIERRNLVEYFAQAPTPMCILNASDLAVVFANEPYARLIGRDVVGRSVREVFTDEELAPFAPAIERVVRTGEDFSGTELPFRDHLLDIVFHALRDSDGAVRRVLVYIQDVTHVVQARRRAEALADDLRDAVRVRDDFLSIASHELRTPVTAMKLQSELALRRVNGAADSTQPLLAFLTRAQRGIARITKLIDEMLDVSRIQRGRMEPHLETFDVSQLVVEALEHLREQLEAAMITVELVAPKTDVIADRSRLDQVFTNLVTNVVRYAPGAPLTVTVVRVDQRVEIAVRDHGPGIRIEDQARIFEQFERLVPSTGVSGLGLGLFIARQMISAQGGSLRVESAPGHGACFVIDLPSA
jgi:signal transduction histidine kinase